ncbi:exportin-1, putative [Plasmodium knowlesi strain H]|uniref:Exportin-T n=3 Tax=Plasmodium knowlesi TaxID=5850 RepID=A0A5K1UUE6_PLAKH|nr:exportin-T, putative [Plasmodium knowlesi strain H]OTN64028.1 Exportin-1 domain containig protein [Plasmodium knowlesi]CAA9990766.1 exportin-T, putative [Plasmodium knowlesi strain H]SBO21119.1 exportin-1, putative [Plasmodium knowlesi strain H]SBO21591.1 exportin-1, putative [Plasmodium knowlesi strain H]VVS80240.1 exportin-T, putative [Plasmodium knowlesi strain H]|eukprot:XP_002262056.1 Exportin-1 domain containig protein [Plasmodium knowlesi strain H]
MDELEVAILCLYGNECTRISKSDAQKYCENFQNTADSWKYCVAKFVDSKRLEVKFFCIHVIVEKLKTLKGEDLLYVKNALYNYLESKYPTANDDPCVVNKIIQLYLSLIEFLYPNNMNDGFKFLINLIMVNNDMNAKNMYINFFLKLMNMLDVEYIDNVYSTKGVQVATNLKEAIKNNDLPIIIECLYFIMSTNVEDISALSIFTLSKYVTWIDINYVVNDKILAYIYQTINGQNNSITESSFSFLTALVRKGMNPLNKIQFIENINIIYVLQNIPKILDISYDMNKKIMLKKGELVNYICLELVESIYEINKLKDYPMNSAKYNEICDKATDMLFLILPHALEIYGIDDFFVASTVEKFFSLLFTKFKTVMGSASAEEGMSGQQVTLGASANGYKIPQAKMNLFINTLICSTVNKFQFPAYIEEFYDEEDEDFITFNNFRENIEKLFQRLILFNKLKAIEIIKNAIIYMNENFDNLKWNTIESTLYAFYITTSIYTEYKGSTMQAGGSAAKDANSSVVSTTCISKTNTGTANANTSGNMSKEVQDMQNGEYNNLLFDCLAELLKNRKILSCNNSLININLMEIFQRLNPFFIKNPQYVEYSLHVFITNGIRCSKNKVVKKSVHIFKKFLKANSFVICNYMKEILQMLESFLEIPCVYQRVASKNPAGNNSANNTTLADMLSLDQDYIKSMYKYIYAGVNYTHEDQNDIYEIAGLLLLHYDYSRAKRIAKGEVNDQIHLLEQQGMQGRGGNPTNINFNRMSSTNSGSGDVKDLNNTTSMQGMCTDLNTRNEKINEELIPNYKDRIFFFKGILNKLLENLSNIKNVYINSSKSQHEVLCLSFTCSVVIRCIGALCKNVNINMTDELINDLDNTLGIIIHEALELFYKNYIVRDSVLYTYRILSNLFKELSLNYTIKILPYFYNISYNMIMTKLQKTNTAGATTSAVVGTQNPLLSFNMMTPSSHPTVGVGSSGEASTCFSNSQEELKYLFNELNELAILVCHLICTYKEKSYDTFIKPYIQNITQIHLNIWKCIIVQSLEMQREQNSVLSPLLLILYNISLNIPSAIHNFVSLDLIALTHKEFCQAFSNEDMVKAKCPDAITSILLVSLNYSNTCDLNICLYAAQTFSNMLNNATCLQNAQEVLSKYPLVQIIDTLCVTLKSLDYSDPKNKRIIQEVMNIFRLFCGFKVNAGCLPSKILESAQICLQNSLLSVFKNNRNDIGVLLQAVNANNQQQFRQILSNFVA